MNQLSQRLDSGIRYVDTNALIRKIVGKWYVILLAMVIFVGAGAVMKMQKTSPSTGVSASEEQQAKIDDKQYVVDYYTNKLASIDSYLNTSALFAINPYCAGRASAGISASDDDEGVRNGILAECAAFIQTGIDYSGYSEDYETGYYSDVVIIDYEVVPGTLVLSVYGPDEEQAGQLFDYVVDQLTDHIDEGLIISDMETSMCYSPDLAEATQIIQDDYSDSKVLLDAARKDLNLLRNDEQNVSFGKKQIVMYAVIGMIVGVIAVGLYYILSGRILSDKELFTQYGLNNLNKGSVIDNGLDYSLIADRLNGTGSADGIVIIRASGSASFEDIGNELKSHGLEREVRTVDQSDLVQKIDTLKGSDVLVAVSEGKTKYKLVSRLLKILVDRGINVTGFIME